MIITKGLQYSTRSGILYYNDVCNNPCKSWINNGSIIKGDYDPEFEKSVNLFYIKSETGLYMYNRRASNDNINYWIDTKELYVFIPIDANDRIAFIIVKSDEGNHTIPFIILDGIGTTVHPESTKAYRDIFKNDEILKYFSQYAFNKVFDR